MAGTPRTPGGSAILERLAPAVQRARRDGRSGADLVDAAERESAYFAADEAFRRSAILRDLARHGRFRIVSGHYDMMSGLVAWLPERASAPRPEATSQRLVDPEQVYGPPPHLVLAMLQAGHRRFLSRARTSADLTVGRRRELTFGDRPQAVVVTCPDSRVVPEILFDAGLGELATVRVFGTALTDEVLASIEESARGGASVCVVLAHSGCEAFALAADVQAAADSQHSRMLSSSTRQLLLSLGPSVEIARANGYAGRSLWDEAARENARSFVHRAGRSRLLRRLGEEGRFVLVPAFYDVTSGHMGWLPEDPAFGSAPAPLAETRSPAVRKPEVQAPVVHVPTVTPEAPRTAVDDPTTSAGSEPGEARFLILILTCAAGISTMGMLMVASLQRSGSQGRS